MKTDVGLADLLMIGHYPGTAIDGWCVLEQKLISMQFVSIEPLDMSWAESGPALGPLCGDLNRGDLLMSFLLKCDLRTETFPASRAAYQSAPLGLVLCELAIAYSLEL